MLGSKSVLAALDFSEYSDVAVEDAFVLAAKFEATVHLLHAFTLQDKREWTVMSTPDLQDARAAEKRKLDAIALKYQPTGHLGEVMWCEGDPAPTILRIAQEHRVDVIVLGASGRSGLKRLVLGSVAEHVVKSASCSVWVVRRPA